MKQLLFTILKPVLLLLLIEAGTVLLVRVAPGYFSDPRLIDSRLSTQAQREMQAEKTTTGGPIVASLQEDVSLLSGRLGESRFYHVPVTELLSSRWRVTGSLLAGGLGLGWLLASAALLPSVFFSNRIAGHLEILFLVPVIVLLAVPAGALAAVSLSSGYGTPTIVIAMLTAPRVYRFLFALLKSHLKADHLFYARALGVGPMRLLLAHLAPCIAPELLALLGTTLVMAIGIMVPVEVIFDLNGVGQLAWTAALNRDAPVIAATTLAAAGAVAIAGVLTDSVLFERLWRNRRRSSECIVPQEAQ